MKINTMMKFSKFNTRSGMLVLALGTAGFSSHAEDKSSNGLSGTLMLLETLELSRQSETLEDHVTLRIKELARQSLTEQQVADTWRVFIQNAKIRDSLVMAVARIQMDMQELDMELREFTLQPHAAQIMDKMRSKQMVIRDADQQIELHEQAARKALMTLMDEYGLNTDMRLRSALFKGIKNSTLSREEKRQARDYIYSYVK